MQDLFGFNTIYVIESIKDDELKTGEQLYNDIIKRIAERENNIWTRFAHIANKSEFRKCFAAIDRLVVKGYYPYVHLEIHGSKNKDGLILKSDELVTWAELSALTRRINISTKNNLVISLATCFGAYFITQIRITDTAPFCGCVVSASELTTGEIIDRFEAFFESLLTNQNFDLAVQRLNEVNELPYTYRFIISEEIFDEAYEMFEKEKFNVKDIAFRNWVNDLTKIVREQSVVYANMQKAKVKDIVRERLLSKKNSFRGEIQRKFLLRDLN